MKRVFVAIEISDEARRSAAACVEGLRQEYPHLRVGWERPEKLHVTLKFVGDLGDAKIEELSREVKKIAAANESYPVHLACAGVFPNMREPRILWLGLNDEGQTSAIAWSIEKECRKIGLQPDARRFSAHLTLARIREPEKSLSLAEKHISNDFEPVGFTIREVVIYESELRPTGSVYSRLAAFPLR